MPQEKKDKGGKEKAGQYTMKDVTKVTEDIFNMSKEKEYNPGAFVHGLIFAVEYAQYAYKIPQQQIAKIRSNCRRFLEEAENKSSQE